MTRREAIESATKRLEGSMKLHGLLAKFGKVRVFPVACEDYVTFTMDDASVLMAEYQNVKETATPPATS